MCFSTKMANFAAHCGNSGGCAWPRPRRAPRATVLNAVLLLGMVLGQMCSPVWFCLPQCGALFIGWCWFGVRIERTGKAPGHIFWGHRLVLGSLSAFAPPGAVPVVGGYLYPSVLRSPGVTPQKCRAAHGPLHPAVTSPPRLCWFCVWFLSGFSGMDVWVFCVVLLVSGVGILFDLVPFRT